MKRIGDFRRKLWQSTVMILYHGTSTEHLDAILEQGVLPRNATGGRGNYDREVPSNPDFVYVSDTYPAYYAAGAVKAEDADPVILAVEIAEDQLYPDEDFIAECLCHTNGSDWKSTRRSVHPALFRSYWQNSLAHNGVACTPSITPEQVVDYRIIPWEGNGNLLLAIGADASPTMTNYSIYGSLYRKCIAAVFAEQELVDAAALVQSLYDAHQEVDWGEVI